MSKFEIRGGKVAALFHAILAMFAGVSRQDAAAMLPLPSKTTVYNHQQLVALARQDETAAALSPQYPFFGVEADEGTIRRCHILIVLITFFNMLTGLPQRVFGGAPRIPSTSAKAELDGMCVPLAKCEAFDILWWLHLTARIRRAPCYSRSRRRRS
jgi:hypothetical protein